jgi:hypothetical protein
LNGFKNGILAFVRFPGFGPRRVHIGHVAGNKIHSKALGAQSGGTDGQAVEKIHFTWFPPEMAVFNPLNLDETKLGGRFVKQAVFGQGCHFSVNIDTVSIPAKSSGSSASRVNDG